MPMPRSDGDAAKRRMAAAPGGSLAGLLPELLRNIHDRLEFLDRFAFATALATSIDDDDVFSPPAPWLHLPSRENQKDPATATLFSIADRRAATVRAPDPAMRGHLVLGSSRGWLATADNRGRIHLVNPATGEQRALPDITTMGVFVPRAHGQCHGWFSVRIDRFLTARFGGGPPFPDNCWGPEGDGSVTFPAAEMRTRFYRKVVLSSIGRRPGTHAAMLILNRNFGAPAFATTAEDGTVAWILAPSRDGVEDAIHHDGRFHSVSYSGAVEAWDRDTASGAYTSTAVAPRLPTTAGIEGSSSSRKYLAAAPGGRLMVVVKDVQVTKDERYHWEDRRTYSFEVHVLGADGQWEKTRDIGDAAVFVGANNSLCVPTTTGRPAEMEAGCVYFTDDDLRDAELRKRNEHRSYSDDDENFEDEYSLKDVRPVGVYSLKDGTVRKIGGLGRQRYRSLAFTPPVWISPSIP